MPSDHSLVSGSSADPRPIADGELKARVRSDLAKQFTWPSSAVPLTKPLQDLGAVMDLRKLAGAAAVVNKAKELSFTLISREYIQTGLNWINAMQRLGLNNFLIISGDAFTSEKLDERGIHSVRANIDETECDPSLVTDDGFSAKGLAMIALKFPVTKFLLNCGYSVIFSDADAVWLQDPAVHLRGADVAFQRVIYHPPAIASLWGFAACSGFVSFRQDPKSIAFLDQCIKTHLWFYCDQVSMNVALFEANPEWSCEQAVWSSPGADVWDDEGQRRAIFTKFRSFPIKGQLAQGGLQVLALPNDKFWRQRWISGSVADIVICHPNAPKDDLEKMKVFEDMGLCFSPGPDDRGRAGECDHSAG
jgi:hypothetical protein